MPTEDINKSLRRSELRRLTGNFLPIRSVAPEGQINGEVVLYWSPMNDCMVSTSKPVLRALC